MDQLARRLDAVADEHSQLAAELRLLPATPTLDVPGRLGRLSAQLAAANDAARRAREGEAARCARQLAELAAGVRVAAGNYHAVSSAVGSAVGSAAEVGFEGRVQA
jgi:hypothetical protein